MHNKGHSKGTYPSPFFPNAKPGSTQVEFTMTIAEQSSFILPSKFAVQFKRMGWVRCPCCGPCFGMHVVCMVYVSVAECPGPHSGTHTGSARFCGNMQTDPLAQANTGSGPFHDPVSTSFHLAYPSLLGLVLACRSAAERPSLYVHVSIDTCSGIVYASPMAGEKASHVIQHCLEAWAAWGKPQQLKTDNGPAYTAKTLVSFCQQMEVQVKHGLPYNPQGQIKICSPIS